MVFVTTLTSSFSATHMRRTNGEILKPTNKTMLILFLIPENSNFKEQNTPKFQIFVAIKSLYRCRIQEFHWWRGSI